jgi:hypothetical protein
MDKSWLYRSETLPSVEVDVVGVCAEDEHLWQTYSMTAYWSPGDRLRADADKVVFRFATVAHLADFSRTTRSGAGGAAARYHPFHSRRSARRLFRSSGDVDPQGGFFRFARPRPTWKWSFVPFK